MPARIFLASVMLCHAAGSAAAALASGRNWQITLDSLECRAAESLLVIGARIRYLGPPGPVEAPVSRLVDGKGREYPPKSLVWKSGSKALAQWLTSSGLANVQSENIAEIQLKFEIAGATAPLSLEFGDVQGFSLTRKPTGKAACESVLKPDQIRAPRAARRARVDASRLDFPVHRARYPCIPSRTVAAEYPPYLPKQLLLFGRGYLPSARQIELPMGKAPAQPYSYVGPDDLIAVEQAARRAIVADFPEYGARSKYFAFNWGVQKSASGNEVYSIGIYAVRPCPK